MVLPFETDDGCAGSAALGLIVLKTDETMEVELREPFARAGLACYHARIPMHPTITPETLAEMARDLPATAALLPDGTPFGAIGYGCTSGATVIGAKKVRELVRGTHPRVPVTDPVSAVMAGLAALNVRRIGLLTPYLPEVTGAMQALLAANGFEVVRVGSFEEGEDRVVARITEAATLAAMAEIGGDPDCEAVFASCTNLRTFGVLDEAERRIGKPVVSSNQALGWHMLTLANVATQGLGPGRLFEY